MENLLNYALTAFVSFFAIMNPLANTPIFLGLVVGESSANKTSIARRASITAFFIVCAFIVAGKYIFELFDLTIPAFKITGGILIFYIGFEMLMSKKSSIHSQERQQENDDVSISPLAIPILAGPGTIVTAMNHVTGANTVDIAVLIAVFALMCFLTYLAFTLSDMIVRRLGNSMIAIVGKLMGLIIAIIGMGMIIEGSKLAFS